MFRQARWRLVAWNVSVLTLILGILGVAVYSVFSSRVYSEVDQKLRSQAAQEILDIRNAGGDPYSIIGNFAYSPYRTVVARTDGTVMYSTDCPWVGFWPQCDPAAMAPTNKGAMREILNGGAPISTTEFRDSPYRVLTFPLQAGGTEYIVQIGRSVQGEEAALKTLTFWLIFGALVGILLTGVGSLFLANRALVPIRQAFARQRQFTADASHELRTPLALIRANAEMLYRTGEKLPPEDGELIGEIIRETDHLNRLVGDLLTLARADADTLKLIKNPVDFRHLVEEVHEDLHVIAESRGIDSSVALNGPVTVQGDEGRLRQLLLILLDNALKYTDPGGRVAVSLDRADGQARLVVSDTGIGIPSQDLPHIFDRFYRVDRAREHESGGTGLGLAIARWIVQAHHGHIKVASQPGKGTEFQIELPTN